jgi:hypothetical protein
MSTTATAPMTIISENLQGGYTRMPRPVLKAKGLSFRAKCLYCLLLDYARDNAFCFPGQETLAADLDTSVDTIQRALHELREYGLISSKQDGYNKTNSYFILRIAETALPGLRQQTPQQVPHPCAEFPHSCGAVEPQECGSNETKSKKTQESDEESSKSPQKGRNEGIPCPSAQQPPTAAYSHSPMTTRNTKTGTKPVQKPLPNLGKALKPLTQDEIDAKRKAGLNASGVSPLSHIIPPEHWQTLEHQARKAPIRPTKTHFSVCTKNAPLVIDTTLEEFTAILGDEPGNTAININRAAKLYRLADLSEEQFREKLYEAFDQARRYPSATIKKKRADGRPNRMPVFFAILQQCVHEVVA